MSPNYSEFREIPFVPWLPVEQRRLWFSWNQKSKVRSFLSLTHHQKYPGTSVDSYKGIGPPDLLCSSHLQLPFGWKQFQPWLKSSTGIVDWSDSTAPNVHKRFLLVSKISFRRHVRWKPFCPDVASGQHELGRRNFGEFLCSNTYLRLK